MEGSPETYADVQINFLRRLSERNKPFGDRIQRLRFMKNFYNSNGFKPVPKGISTTITTVLKKIKEGGTFLFMKGNPDLTQLFKEVRETYSVSLKREDIIEAVEIEIKNLKRQIQEEQSNAKRAIEMYEGKVRHCDETMQRLNSLLAPPQSDSSSSSTSLSSSSSKSSLSLSSNSSSSSSD